MNDPKKIKYYKEWGLHLPFIMPEGVIMPFQLVRDIATSTTYSIKFYCINDDNEEIDLGVECPCVLDYFRTRTVGSVDYITYLGVEGRGDCSDCIADNIPAGGYYVVVSDGTNTWYSENIRVLGESEFTGGIAGENYRKWSDSDIDIRTTDGTTLRIY